MKRSVCLILALVLIMSTLMVGCTPAQASDETMMEVPATTETPTTNEPATLEVEEVIAEPVVEETEPPKITVDEVPRYNQLDYTCKFGNVTIESTGQPATVRNSGCGITCLAMVASYLLDDPTLTPDILAEQFGKYNTSCGSAWSLFIDSAEVLGLGEVKQVHDWNGGDVEQALRDGCIVISNQRKGVFTKSGHYIVLTGITEDGKVMVNDPNGANWTDPSMIDGFENGFKHTDVSYTSAAYWIYQPKGSIK